MTIPGSAGWSVSLQKEYRTIITLYFSTDGRGWYLIRHLQFDSPAPLKIGFLAQSPTGRHCSVQFPDIHYSTRKIRDPYLGE